MFSNFFFLLSSFFFNSPLPFAQVSGRILGRPATRRGSPISATGGAPQWSLFISFPRQQESYELKKERKRERERERERTGVNVVEKKNGKNKKKESTEMKR